MIFLQIDPLSKPVAIVEILFLLAGAAFIGWLVARWVMAGRINGLRESVAERQAELDECRSFHDQSSLRQEKVVLTNHEEQIDTNHFVMPEPILSVPDNLKLVEGIGPRIEELLNADGIYTFARLATTSSDHLTTLLKKAGPRFQIHNPASWPQQAALARDGKWEELKAMQQNLRGGRA